MPGADGASGPGADDVDRACADEHGTADHDAAPAAEHGPAEYCAAEYCAAGYGAVEYCAVEYCAAEYCAAGYGAVEYCAVEYCAAEYCAVEYCAVEYCAAGYGAVEYCAAGYGAAEQRAAHQHVDGEPFDHRLVYPDVYFGAFVFDHHDPSVVETADLDQPGDVDDRASPLEADRPGQVTAAGRERPGQPAAGVGPRARRRPPPHTPTGADAGAGWHSGPARRGPGADPGP